MWFNDCGFFAYISNSMIVHVDAAVYGVLLQMIANLEKTCNSHLIDTRNQNQSYGIHVIYMCGVL